MFRFQSGESEHSNLVSNVVPIVGVIVFFDLSNERRSHVADSVSHDLDVLQPNSVEFGRSKDLFDNSGSMNGRVGVGSSSEALHLRDDVVGFRGGIANCAQTAHSLSVETEVFGK